MAKGREESDGRVVPQGRRKPVVTAATQGGKATTASKQARQLGLFHETADSPQGDDGGAAVGQPIPATTAVPKSWDALMIVREPQRAQPYAPTPPHAGAIVLGAVGGVHTKRGLSPAMTMEEVAKDENLMRAFKRVASNDGAPISRAVCG